MREAGDICLADVNQEQRRRVLIVSNARFNRTADRVLVAPEIASRADEVLFPWRVPVGDIVFAVDLLRSIPAERLLDRIDRAPHSAMRAVRLAVLNIT
jgi:mRNA-degrading endonuclease toxin of MazEF toxin-antitoxin module